jgi:hypothetical protein
MLIFLDELAGLVGAAFARTPAFEPLLGSPIHAGKYWLDVDYPGGPPPEYERAGYAFSHYSLHNPSLHSVLALSGPITTLLGQCGPFHQLICHVLRGHYGAGQRLPFRLYGRVHEPYGNLNLQKPGSFSTTEQTWSPQSRGSRLVLQVFHTQQSPGIEQGFRPLRYPRH